MLSQRLKHWKDWGLAGQPRVLEYFTAGQNHTAALVEANQQQWVVKLFDHSFDIAVSAQSWAAEQQIAPPIVYANNDLAVMTYVAARPFETADLARLAHTLGTLHQSTNTELSRFDFMSFCNQYLATADALTKQQHRTLLPVLQQFIDDPTPWCPCHNDLVRSNCLFTNERAWLIDWEYAMQHNPWFDLAAIILYFELDTKQSTRFLNAYSSAYLNSGSSQDSLDWAAKIDQPIFQAAQLALLWGDLLWHLNKYGNHYRVDNPKRFKLLAHLAANLAIQLPSSAPSSLHF
ncbi:phosphotransferase [Arenicella xantha]|uniref:Phosphotransferase family enzyme n=1 Tax=Arenicella xantha TaxID=644221 RepID=A0A395JTN5_9GAMM|nr:phosphotransferase [Arenicella xantha]RBP53692.1 phosphotransferase family enzyme [Arenicella xantha]